MKSWLLRIGRISFDLLVRAMDRTGFTFWRAYNWAYNWLIGRRKRAIRSVLHISYASHQPFMLSRLQRLEGVRAAYLSVNPDVGRLNVGYDYALLYQRNIVLRRFLAHLYLWTVLARFDVLHFHFITPLTNGWREFEYMSRLGKVMVMHFRGCDVRNRTTNIRLHPEMNLCQECDYPAGTCENEEHERKLEIARKYGDLVFVTTPDMLDFWPEAEHVPFVIPHGIDWDAIRPLERDPEVFRVVTSSNHPGLDGVPHIRRAVERLKAEGHRIELIEVIQQKYEDALSAYKSADVYVSKLRMGYYNNANIECMLLGIPNMSYIRPEFLEPLPDCPIIITRPDTVYENLKKYISRRDELAEIGRKGPEFVKRHHDGRQIAALLIDRYNQAWREKKSRRDIDRRGQK